MNRLLPALVLLLGAACSAPAMQAPAAAEDALFPHAEPYATAGTHGQDWLGEDPPCAICHEVETEEVATTPGCRACHAGYPHPAGWERGAQHGPAYAEAAEEHGCPDCHGAELDGGAAGVACDGCHVAWPHGPGWAESGGHGTWLAGVRTFDACRGCHALGATPETEATDSCGDCHADYPHTEGWRDPEAHGAAWFAGDCGTCHGGEQLEGGAWAPSCRTCHSIWPHEEGWDRGHIPVADQGHPAGCMNCHDPGDGPATMLADCSAGCHGAAP